MATQNTALAAALATTVAPNLPALSDIRETCAFATSHAQHVHLNHQNLRSFARSITAPPDHWLITNPHNLLALPLPLLATILLYFEVIDYSFWPDPTTNSPLTTSQSSKTPTAKTSQSVPKWTVKTPSSPLDGSVALLYLLIQNFQQNPTIDFSTFTDADFYHFFHPTKNPNEPLDDPAKAISPIPEIPLLTKRSQTLRETSRILQHQLNNNFYAAIKTFTTDKQLFHFLIATFPSFRDQRTYTPKSTPQNSQTSVNNTTTTLPPKTIYFYKLAQLLTSDLLFVRHHLEHIPVNTSNLPGCADYKIPQTLRALDLISYDKELSALVDSRQLIPKNSPYEVEIRAATISAIAFLHDQLPQFSPIQINDYLFLTSRNLKRKQPYHLTRSTNY